MNKQEAIKQVELMGEYERFVDEPISKKSVLNILSQIDEPQKVEIPQLVADWLEIARRQHLSLGQAMEHWEMSEKIEKWFQYANNQETFARAWLDGYEVEQEKHYHVEFKLTGQELIYDEENEAFYFYHIQMREVYNAFTKQKLIDAGFEGVFDNPMFEVEEVE